MNYPDIAMIIASLIVSFIFVQCWRAHTAMVRQIETLENLALKDQREMRDLRKEVSNFIKATLKS